mgnify:CR=1 FL=1
MYVKRALKFIGFQSILIDWMSQTKVGVSPENCLVLEDTPAGVTAAKSAGMKVIAIPNAYTKGSDFSNADMVVSSLEAVDLELVYSVL